MFNLLFKGKLEIIKDKVKYMPVQTVFLNCHVCVTLLHKQTFAHTVLAVSLCYLLFFFLLNFGSIIK